MSRIGKQPVPIPAGVDVTIDGQNVTVKGPKGALDLTVAEPITVARNDDGAIVVTRPDDERHNRFLGVLFHLFWKFEFWSGARRVRRRQRKRFRLRRHQRFRAAHQC